MAARLTALEPQLTLAGSLEVRAVEPGQRRQRFRVLGANHRMHSLAQDVAGNNGRAANVLGYFAVWDLSVAGFAA